ncbi:hypothetical protein BREVNS_0822 [Brevinematales bacterium NS]|nr:hypothetical protein BREVNS_0822 [Brevinematales bacterium NS]
MPNGSHEIIDDFELDMDIETITLDDIDLREFEEPLPQEFASSPGTMEVGSIGNIENIQISTASFGGPAGGIGEGTAGGGGAPGVETGPLPLSGSFSLEPEEIKLSAPSITIQTENLTISSPQLGMAPAEGISPSQTSPLSSFEEVPPTSPETLPTGMTEAPSIESLNVDELEFGGPVPLSEGEEIPSQELEVPTIEKEETINLLSEEEPPIQEATTEEIAIKEEPELPQEEGAEEISPQESRPINDKDEIISLSGDELDKFLYGDTIGGVEVIPEEAGEEVILPPVEETIPETLIAPEEVASQGERIYVESTKNHVPLEENFELIVENEASADKETVYTSEPTEVLREGPAGPEREPEVPLPDLEELDKVVNEPSSMLSSEELPTSTPQEPVLLEAEEISLEPITLDEEPIPFAVEEEGSKSLVIEEASPETIEMVEAEPTVIEVGESPLVSEITSPTEEAKDVDFQFDLSAIPDLQPTVEDENEPIALSLEELNNIEVTEEPPLSMASATPEEEEGNIEIASAGPEESLSELERGLEIPVETEVPLSPESFESMIAEEEKIEEIKQQDLNQLIEIAEPDVESLENETESLLGAEETLPPLEEAETVEVSLADLGVTANEEISEPIVSEAYMEAPVAEEMDRRQVIETNLDTLSGTTREELRKVIQYLDNLLADLPEEKIKEFAQSEYYDLYMKIMEKLGL